ncbi:MAG: hypothetical protein ACWGOL_11175 [Desulfuromonadales bacterium]
MIPGEYRYGWGVYSLPMLRELVPGDPLQPLPVYPAGMARTLVKETPWRALILSILMACLSICLLLVIGQDRSETMQRTEPEPVKVAVVLPPEVPQPPPAAEVHVPAPVRRQIPPPVKIPPVPEPVVHEPPQVVQPKPVPPPKKPLPVKQTPPEEVALPQPTQIAQRRPEPALKAPSALPQRKAEMPVQPEATLSVAPTLTSYEQPKRIAEAVALPQQKTSFSSDTEVTGLVAQAPSKRVADRRPTRASLPSTSKMAIGKTSSAELNAVNTGLSSQQYDTGRKAATMSSLAPRETVTTSRVEEAAIGSPQASSMHSEIGARTSDDRDAVAARNTVAFASASPQESLIGPSANVINTSTSATTALPVEGGSFDFLDFMSSSELDRSLMVSLNRLKTCLDPGAETKLKTRLAALLSQPAMCRSGGVVFDIRNPESAYSIHVDLYNYEQKQFQDRCDALTLAVQSCEARR